MSYSVLDEMEACRRDGAYRFRMAWPTLTDKNLGSRWFWGLQNRVCAPAAGKERARTFCRNVLYRYRTFSISTKHPVLPRRIAYL